MKEKRAKTKNKTKKNNGRPKHTKTNLLFEEEVRIFHKIGTKAKKKDSQIKTHTQKENEMRFFLFFFFFISIQVQETNHWPVRIKM